MREIGAFEAKNKLAALLDDVAHGEEITITRRGKPIAKLSPYTAIDRTKAVTAIERMAKLRAGTTLGPDLTIRNLIDDGRH